MGEKAEAGKNQALFRDVNERIGEVASAPPDELVDRLCECDDTACTETIAISTSEYETIRDGSTRFLLRPGHDRADVERVIGQTEHYIVVEKIGPAADVAAQLDPRT